MFCLWNGLNGEKPTQNMIAQATFKDRPSITRLLRNLERQGLIYREAKDGDKRANHVILTEKGKSIEKSVTDATKKAMESIFYGFSHEEATKAFSYLEKIFDNIK
jgi:DNA-binding MarR family transcriptional regulator